MLLTLIDLFREWDTVTVIAQCGDEDIILDVLSLN